MFHGRHFWRSSTGCTGGCSRTFSHNGKWFKDDGESVRFKDDGESVRFKDDEGSEEFFVAFVEEVVGS